MVTEVTMGPSNAQITKKAIFQRGGGGINIYTRSPVYPYENHPSLICVWIITDEVGKQEQ